MIVLAIDPGNEQSAYVRWETAISLDDCKTWGCAVERGKVPNDEMRDLMKKWRAYGTLAIEMVASYGMPVGREIFETCVWIGRFVEAWGGPVEFIYRKDVKLHLCGQPRAKDANIRQALIDRFGGKQVAIGNKAKPGPLYGVKTDIWSALAIAVTYSDRIAAQEAP